MENEEWRVESFPFPAFHFPLPKDSYSLLYGLDILAELLDVELLV